MPKLSNHGDYSVKNVKYFTGREGQGYNASLYRGRRKIAFLRNMADGGMGWVDWDTSLPDWREERERYEAFITEIPTVAWEDYFGDLGGISSHQEPLTIDSDLFIDDLITAYEEQKWERKLQRLCQTQTLIRFQDDPETSYRTVNAPFNPTLRQYLVDRHGERLAEFINERFE